MEPKYKVALLLIFFSHRYIYKRELVESVREMVSPHERQIMQNYYFVFTEGKQQLRLGFFLDPLVQLLWSRFRNVKAEAIMEILRQEGSEHFLDHILEMQ